MSIFDYNNFVNEELTPEEIEQRRKEATKSHMRLFLSKDIADILKRMNDKTGISNDLLTLSKRDQDFDVSFVGKGKDENMISFLATSRVKRMETESGLDVRSARSDYDSDLWKSPQRQEMRTGKFLGKIFKSKYSSAQIEKFVNEFKAKFDDTNDKLRVVYGDDIKKWYHGNTYASGGGSLNNSCMRGSSQQSYFDIYTKNHQDNGGYDYKGKFYKYSYVGMLILTDDNDKLLARAIVWFNTVKPQVVDDNGNRIEGRVFMDRIYFSSDHHENTFKEYAKKNGWIYKQQQSYNNPSYIDPIDGSKHTLTITARLKPGKYNKYPYMDTMLYYTPKSGRMSSNPGKYVGMPRYKCQSTGGGAEHIQDR